MEVYTWNWVYYNVGLIELRDDIKFSLFGVEHGTKGLRSAFENIVAPACHYQ